MKSAPLNAFVRNASGHNAVKKLRSSNRVPAVIYGRTTQPQNLELDVKELETLIHHSASETLLVDLSVAEDKARPKRLALVQEIQHHPLNGSLLHIDFHEVAADETVTITVPVEPMGEATGVKTGGGTLEHVLFKLRVRGLPKDIPEVITVDVSALEIGKAIHIGEIPSLAGVEILGDKKLPVFSVAAPVTEAQEADTAAAATPTAGEVEMIKEKKDDAAGAEKAGGDKKAAEKKK
ncbi:MAG: 50S ribosomal protein L25 [Verrucomicrobia bacterium]|nr:50S ribosomal protein L25 [Verrucomicrobiota bacterium]